MLFGEAVGPRLPSVLATLATFGIIAWFVRRHSDDSRAQVGVLVLAGCLLVVGVGRMLLTDPLLDLAVVGAMTAFWESIDLGSARWRIASAAWLGVGVLAKGPVILILFAIIAAWVFWRQPELRPKFRGGWIAGTAVLIVIVATWYLPAYLIDGNVFVQKFLIEQNVGRFTGGDAAHTIGGVASLSFYVPILLLGMLPWSVLVPSAFLKTLRDARQENASAPLERYLVAWSSTVFLFFSVSGAKLPHYILPAIPPLAILLAISRPSLASGRNMMAAGLWVVAVAAIADLAFPWWYGDRPLVLAGKPLYPSGQRDLHAYARFLRAEGGDVSVFQMGRRQADRGTGTSHLMETSQPSLLFYLNRDVLDTDDFGSILAAKKPEWILTRAGRINTEEFARAQGAGQRLEQVHVSIPEQNYVLYRLIRAPIPRSR